MRKSSKCFYPFRDEVVHLLSMFSGHYNVGQGCVFVSTRDLNATGQTEDYTPLWTFEAIIDQRVQFHFSHYILAYNFIEIGDGTIKENATRLAQFKGFDTPSDVISVSHLAWLSVDKRLGWQHIELEINLSSYQVG